MHLPDDLVEMLRSHIERYLPDEPPSDAWLFTVRDGPMYDNAIDWRWRATRTSAGLPKVRLHDLRHFYASGLIAAGVTSSPSSGRSGTPRRPPR